MKTTAKQIALLALWVSLTFAGGKSAYADSQAPKEKPLSTEHWSLPYKKLHESVLKIEEGAVRNYFPEFMIIRDGTVITTLQIDAFAAKVLKEADEILEPYREGLQQCVEKNQTEFRVPKTYSFERFAWFMDSYVRVLVKAVGSQDESPTVNGVREKRVTTDRALYSYTKLISAYLEEKMDRFKTMDNDYYASDRALVTALSDLARRVFRIELKEKFDRKELVEKGLKSQPILRDLASTPEDTELASGIEPLTRLVQGKEAEPICKVLLPAKKSNVAKVSD